MNTAVVFFAGVIPAFYAGFRYCDHLHRKGRTMTEPTPTKSHLSRLVDWLAEGNRLVGIVIVALIFAFLSGVYAFTADSAGRGRDDDNLECLNAYVTEIGLTQAPRTLASKAMNDARRDWDRGYSKAKGATELNKDQLKQRYLTYYEAYETVAAQNPPVPTILQFCRERAE